MSEELFFETDAAIITRLGRELVGKQETALIELVKNGFDADATELMWFSNDPDRVPLSKSETTVWE